MKQLLITIAAVMLVGCGFDEGYGINDKEPHPFLPAKVTLVPLIESARTGDVEGVKKAIAAGVDVNISDGIRTALGAAAVWGYQEIVKLLISNGADVNLKGAGGMTPLHLAIKYKDVVALIIDEGGNVNATNGIGDTPLHIAAQQGNKAVVQLLITQGSKINAKTDLGDTPLDLANLKIIDSRDYKGAIEILRKHGAKTGEELKAEGK